jgi:hypothetical protein
MQDGCAWVEAVKQDKAAGVCVNARDGGAAVMVVKATAEFDVAAGDDAAIVTKPPAGTETGAV